MRLLFIDSTKKIMRRKSRISTGILTTLLLTTGLLGYNVYGTNTEDEPLLQSIDSGLFHEDGNDNLPLPNIYNLESLDIYQGNNFAVVLLKALDNIEGSSEKTRQALSELREALTDFKNFSKVNFGNEDYFKSYSRVLSTFLKARDAVDENETDADLKDFISLAHRYINLAYVRYNTEKILSQTRAALEGVQGISSSSSGTISINIPVPAVPGMTANLDLFVDNSSFGSTGTSFFTVTRTKGAKAGITFNISLAALSGKVSYEQSKIQLLYSLESFMDYLNQSKSKKIKKTIFSFGGIKMDSVLKDREALQAEETFALANNARFEELLNKYQGLSENQILTWVDITKAKTTDSVVEKTGGLELSSNVTVPLSKLGITLKGTTGRRIFNKNSPFLSSLNNDCSLADGWTEEEFEKVIGGSKFDFSYTIDSPQNLLKKVNTYISVISRLAALQLQLKTEKDRDIIKSKKSDIKSLESKKHGLESELSPRKKIGSYGRSGFIRGATLTAVKLRNRNVDLDNNNNSIFEMIYLRLQQLSALNIFSKNTTGIRKAVGYGITTDQKVAVKAKTKNLTATFSMTVPAIGNVSVSATRKQVKDSPFLQENGTYITLQFSLPIYATGVVGMAVLREKFRSVFSKIPANFPFNMDDFKNIALAFGVTNGINAANSVIGGLGSPISVGASGSAAFTIVFKQVDPITATKPLPNQSLITKNNRKYILDFVAITTNLNSSASANLDKLPIALKLTASTGKVAKRTGPNTFHDMSSKFNALSIGKEDSASNESTAINSLAAGQSGQILQLFYNIGSEDSTNSKVELQEMYNNILNRISNSEEKSKIDEIFDDFIKSCQQLSLDHESSVSESAESEIESLTGNTAQNYEGINMENFQKAFDLYKQILQLQYDYIFRPYYDSSFDEAKHKTNNSHRRYLSKADSRKNL